MTRCYFSVFATLFLLGIQSCSDTETGGNNIRATRYEGYKGTLHVACDEGLENIIKQQKEVFEFIYDSVQLDISYKVEKDLLTDFRSATSSVLLLGRPLKPAEINNLKNLDTIYVEELAIAYDAVALIGSKDFNDSELDFEFLKSYFAPNAPSSTPRLVFSNQHSGLVRFVLDSLGYKEKVSANVFAMHSAEEVISYVSESKNAIGFIPYNLISDIDDERAKQVLKSVKILSLRAKNEKGEVVRVSANQSDIITRDYPLIRTVNAVTRFSHQDNLESLFISFLHREKGAKIFLKAGLIPARMPERDIIVNDSELTGSK